MVPIRDSQEPPIADISDELLLPTSSLNSILLFKVS